MFDGVLNHISAQSPAFQEYLNGNPDFKDIPIVVVSTEGSQTRVERLQDKGARFIHKPFTPETVRDTVKAFLGDGVFDGTADEKYNGRRRH